MAQSNSTTKISRSILVILVSLIFNISAYAFSPPRFSLQTPLEAIPQVANKDYQIGNTWGKRPVKPEEFENNPELARAVKATAKIGGGTGFVLTLVGQRIIFATNYHVCPSAWMCMGSYARFPYLDNLQVELGRMLGSWKEVDLALFELNVSIDSSAAKKLLSVARNFSYDDPWDKGDPLMTIGFGSANNPNRVMMIGDDSDCLAFSSPEQSRLMADPDQFNPGSYSAWSFAVGCDVSHGDSGSAMVHRVTGQVLGLIWTGKFPKVTRIQDSGYLWSLLTLEDHEDIWGELNYAIPASKIKEAILKFVESQPLNPATPTLKDLISSEETL